MLENLDRVNWEEIEPDVPDLLRALASPDAQRVNDALWDLAGEYIAHQGDVFESAAYAVPFLVELAASPQVLRRDGILTVVQLCATGTGYRDAYPGWFPPDPEWPPQQWPAERLADVRATHEAVVREVPRLMALLSDEDAVVRMTATYPLAYCPERGEVIEPALLRRLKVEKDGAARGSMLEALHHLWRCKPPSRGWRLTPRQQMNLWARIMRSPQEAPLARQIAALFHLRAVCEKAVAETTSLFLQDEINAEHRFTFDGKCVFVEMAKTLQSWPEVGLEWLLKLLKSHNANVRHSVLHALEFEYFRSRAATRRAVPHVVPLMTDESQLVHYGVRNCLYHLAEAGLLSGVDFQPYLKHARPEVRKLASEVANVARKAMKPAKPSPKKRPRPKVGDILDFMRILKTKGNSSEPYRYWQVIEAMEALGDLGPKAVEAVPLLKKALSHKSALERKAAAHALWKIEGNVDDLLPFLIEELQQSRFDEGVLRLLHDIGPAATPAAPLVRRFVESDQRVTDMETDERRCAMARQALEAIEGHA